MSYEKEFEEFEKLTDEELQKMLDEHELSDEAMDAVSGGASAHQGETEEECRKRYQDYVKSNPKSKINPFDIWLICRNKPKKI